MLAFLLALVPLPCPQVSAPVPRLASPPSVGPYVPTEQGSVLLIIGDDIAAADLDPLLEAGALPNLAQIASHGTRFLRAYANGVCSPSRQSILLGRYHTGDAGQVCQDFGGDPIPSSEVTLPEIEPFSFRALIGKHHMGRNPDGVWPYVYRTQGFLTWRAGSPMNVRDCFGTNYSAWTRVDDGQVEDISLDYEPVAVRDEALAWWNSQPPTQPRLLWLAPNLAHGPFHVPPAELLPPGFNVAVFQRSRYEAMIRALDATLGELLASVDWSRDLVIFIGDNGTPPQVAPDPARAKTTTYQRGIHVPLLVSGPGFAAGVQSAALVHEVDLFATVARHFGRHGQVRTSDALPLQGTLGHDHVICTGTSDLCAFDGQVKFRRLDTGVEMLFDLAADPREDTSFLGDPAYAAVEARLRAELDAYQARP